MFFCLLKRRQLFALKHAFDHNVLQAGSGSASFVGSILAGVILLTGPIAAFGVNRYQKDLDSFFSQNFDEEQNMMSYSFSGLGPGPPAWLDR